MGYIEKSLTNIGFLVVCMNLVVQVAYSDIKCLKITTSKGKLVSKLVSTKKRSCPKKTIKLFDTATFIGAQGVQGIQGAQGPVGANGSNGINGSVSAWGDGSAGDLVVNDSDTLQATNPQYRNVVINAGNTLNVVSGTTIKATGTCTIAGSIAVGAGSNGGSSSQYNSTTLSPSRRYANYGVSYGPSGVAEYGTNGADLKGGYGGKKISSEQAGTLVRLRRTSFGGGGESGGGSFSGGAGGGGFALYCKGGISISGIISADGVSGSNGGGGGAGGLIVIASEASIVNSGIISAKGGSGGNSNIGYGIGGGGGGGIIHFISANIIDSGGINVSGGSAGSLGLQVTNNPRMAGAGGGALGGDGGDGGDVTFNNTTKAAGAGTAGYFFETQTNPTSLIL